MTLSAFLLVLLSVLLHAVWHFLSKSGHPSIAFFSLLSFCVLLTLTPFACIAGIAPWQLPASVLICAVAGGCCGMCVDVGMAVAYARTDISVAYPVSRALPVLFTGVATTLFGVGRALGVMAWMAMLVIATGCILMALGDLRQGKKLRWSNGYWGILVSAVGVTAYTVVDGIGIHAIRAAYPDVGVVGLAALYSAVRECVIFSLLLPLALLLPGERIKYRKPLFGSYQPYVAGCFAATAYLLVLLAMAQVSNVSYIQAFRQLSLPLGMVLGVVFLKEKPTAPRLIGMALILLGLALAWRS